MRQSLYGIHDKADQARYFPVKEMDKRMNYDMTVCLPDGEEMLRRLITPGISQYLVDHFYQLLINHAGEQCTAEDVTTIFAESVVAYSAGLPPICMVEVCKKLSALVMTLIDDEGVRKQVIEELGTLGLIFAE